ncbi:MAG: helix-turn-helix domain-containing protein [Clostridiales bacterium]|nr:helix-turn-helix domain-containing protein [Clostridiales bacterium]
MQLGEKLKKLRTDNGISQSELAAVLYVSRSAVAKWENGLGVPCRQSLEKIAEYFSVSKDYFYADGVEDNVAEEVAAKISSNTMPQAARVCSFVASVLLFVYAAVISAFLVSQDHFDGGFAVLTEGMTMALIIVGIVMTVAQFKRGQSLSARFLSYGIGVGVGVLFSCYFAESYLGFVKYGSFCLGAPVVLIAVNELMQFIVRRIYNVGNDCDEVDNRTRRKLYVCLAIATAMFGLCLYPLIIHTVEFYYNIGILIFSAGLFLSVVIALLVAITNKRHTKNVLAYSFGVLMFCGMLLIMPSVLDITNDGIVRGQNFYEYLAYEITAMIECGMILVLALRHYCSDFFRAALLRMSHATANN